MTEVVKATKKNKIENAKIIDVAKETCKSLGFLEGTKEFSNCSLKIYSQSVEITSIKKESSSTQSISTQSSSTQSGSYSSSAGNSTGSNSNFKPRLYYDLTLGGMRECSHDPGATGNCLSFKPFNATSYDRDTLFYNSNSNSMQPCVGIITANGKCTAYGIFNYSKTIEDKGQLFYDPKNKKMTTCLFITATGTCSHYDLVPNKWSKQSSVFKEPGSDVFKEPSVTFKEPGSDIFKEPSVIFKEPGFEFKF